MGQKIASEKVGKTDENQEWVTGQKNSYVSAIFYIVVNYFVFRFICNILSLIYLKLILLWYLCTVFEICIIVL